MMMMMMIRTNWTNGDADKAMCRNVEEIQELPPKGNMITDGEWLKNSLDQTFDALIGR